MLPRALHWLRANASLAFIAAALISIAVSAFNIAFAAFSIAYLALCAATHLLHKFQKTTPTPLIASPLHAAMLGLVLMAGLSLLITATPELTNVQVARLYIGMGACWGLRNWLQQRSVSSSILLSLSALGIGFSLLAPFGVDWFSGKLPIPLSIYTAFPRLLSDGIHPNVMAGVMALLLPISLAATATGSWRNRFFHGLAAALMLSILILTQSRGGLLAFTLSLAIWVALRWAKARPLIWGVGFICLLVALAASVSPNALPAMLNRFIQNLLLVGNSGSAELRYEAWQRAWYMIQDFPFTGIGMGGYKLISDVMYPTFVSPEALPHAHNLFLQIAVDLGLPGLLAWLVIVNTAIYTCLAALRATPVNPSQRTLALGLFTSQIALLVHGLVDAVVWGQVRVSPVLWVLLGIALAWHQVRYTRHLHA